MEVQVNMWAVLLATLSSFVVGFVWYARPVFGNAWMKLVGMDSSKQQTGMAKAMASAFVASFVMAYVLAHVTYLSNNFFHDSFMKDALQTAFWLWLGLSAATLVVHDAFEQRPMKLTIMNMGNQLATLLAMGFIIGLLKP